MDKLIPLFKGFKRQEKAPVDSSSVFETLAAAQAYAQTSTIAYDGQIISVKEDSNAIFLVHNHELVRFNSEKEFRDSIKFENDTLIVGDIQIDLSPLKVKADLAETDENSSAYVANKKLSHFENDADFITAAEADEKFGTIKEIKGDGVEVSRGVVTITAPDVSEFIKKDVADLVNYTRSDAIPTKIKFTKEDSRTYTLELANNKGDVFEKATLDFKDLDEGIVDINVVEGGIELVLENGTKSPLIKTEDLVKGFIKDSTKINGYELKSDVVLTAGDVGAYSISEVNAKLAEKVSQEDLEDYFKKEDIDSTNLVSLDTAQTITAEKTFNEDIRLGADVAITDSTKNVNVIGLSSHFNSVIVGDRDSAVRLELEGAGDLTFNDAKILTENEVNEKLEALEVEINERAITREEREELSSLRTDLITVRDYVDASSASVRRDLSKVDTDNKTEILNKLTSEESARKLEDSKLSVKIDQARSEMVNTGSDQTIAGKKTFTAQTQFDNSVVVEKPLYTNDIYINGNIYQDGGVFNVAVENIKTSDNFITLREGATAGLTERGLNSANPYAGLIFEKYDGITNGHIFIDKDGIIRVGDNSEEQPLATREEVPIDGGFAIWDKNATLFRTTKNVTSQTEFQRFTEEVPTLYAKKTELPEKVSELYNDANYATKSELPTKLSQLQDDKNYATKTYVNSLDETNVKNFYLNGNKIDKDASGNVKVTLANVASTGRYSDILNKPTKLSEFENDTGFIKEGTLELNDYYKKSETESLVEEVRTDVNSKLDSKLEKITSTGTNLMAYTYTGSEQGSIRISPSAVKNTIPLRGENGVLNVGTPELETHATTKKYVDDNFLKKSVSNDKESVTINGNLTITGSILHGGSSYETNVEQIRSKNDFITLRDGNNSGLTTGQYTGFKFNKYDGVNNGHLVVDKDGTARVGDVGSEQPLLTREEAANLTDGEVLVWNTANNRAEGSSDFVKNTDYASSSKAGIIKGSSSYGLGILEDGMGYIIGASETDVTNKSTNYRPITPKVLDYAVKTGLTTNALEWTVDEMTAARTLIGAIGNTEYSTNSTHGIVKTGAGLAVSNDGIIRTYPATLELVNAKTDSYRPITSSLIDAAVKTGLTTNALEWIDDEKAAARTLIGAVGTEDIATSSTAGVVKVAGGDYGVMLRSDGILQLNYASDNDIKKKDKYRYVITPINLDYAVKTSISTNVHELDDTEKAAAQNWLDVPSNKTVDDKIAAVEAKIPTISLTALEDGSYSLDITTGG